MMIEIERAKGNGIRWAIGREDGLRGSTWRLWGNKKGDFYLAARTMGHMLKTSFHRDGRCHSGLTSSYAAKKGIEQRHMDVWQLPAQQIVRVIQVLLPASDLRVYEERGRKKKMVWLPAPQSAHLAVVSIFIAERDLDEVPELVPPGAQPIGLLATKTRLCWAVYATNPLDERIEGHIAWLGTESHRTQDQLTCPETQVLGAG